MRDQELIQALREHAECQKAFEDLGGESGIYADAYNDLAENFYGIPAAKVVSLHDIYRVIAGHSYYHGDRILAALTCIAEGKKVNSVRSPDVAPVVHAQWIEDGSGIIICPECKRGYDLIAKYTHYCPNCGAKMDGGAGNG